MIYRIIYWKYYTREYISCKVEADSEVEAESLFMEIEGDNVRATIESIYEETDECFYSKKESVEQWLKNNMII